MESLVDNLHQTRNENTPPRRLELMTEDCHDNTNEDTGLHHPSTGGDTMPKTPLNTDISTINVAMGCLMMFSGIAMLGLGVVINAILSFKSTKGSPGPAPHIWWTGIPPFIFGMAIAYTALKRNRNQMYIWCTVMIVSLFTQISMMGILGNFTTSHYDVYPLLGYKNGHPICVTFWHKCYCQDYFHGIYSDLELPGVHYLHEGNIKWRETCFRSCHDLHLVSRLYYSLMACLAVYIFVSILAFLLGYNGTICAKQNVRFQRLVEDTDILHTDSVLYRDQELEDGQGASTSQTETRDMDSQPCGLDPSQLVKLQRDDKNSSKEIFQL